MIRPSLTAYRLPRTAVLNFQFPISNFQFPIIRLLLPSFCRRFHRFPRALICVIGVICGSVQIAFAANPLANVPTQSWVYGSVDCLKTLGLIHTIPSTSRPWTRGYTARLVAEAVATESARARPLSGAASYHLQRLVAEFADELTPSPSTAPFRSFRPLIRLPVDSQRSVEMDEYNRIRADSGARYGSIGAVFNTSGDPRFVAYTRMELFKYLSPLSNMRDSSYIDHVPGMREYAGRNGILFSTSEAYLQFRIPWMNLEVGRDYLYWGPGYTGSVILSNTAPSLNQVKLTADFRQVKLIAFTAALSPYRNLQPFVSGQRIEVSLWNHLQLGAVIMGFHCNDSLQTQDFWGYINPMIPIYPELSAGGHNPSYKQTDFRPGFDVTGYLPRTKLYAQLFLDNYEFNPAVRKRPIRSPDAYAWEAGLLSDPLPELGVRYEYTHITNFCYYFDVYPQLVMTNYGACLGHPLGPDADQHYAELDWYGSRWGYLSLLGTVVRRGQYNAGDWYNRRMPPNTPLDPRFPTGDVVEHDLSIGPQVVVDPYSWLKLTAGASWYWITNVDNNEGQKRQGLSLSLNLEHRYR